MSFPLSPTNGQFAILNGIAYTYSTATTAWTRSVAFPIVNSTNFLSITNTTATVSTSTGALTVAGGVGIAGGLYVGGTITATSLTLTTGETDQGTLVIQSSNSATSTVTGALIVVGGVGIGGSLYVGGGIVSSTTGTTAGSAGTITPITTVNQYDIFTLNTNSTVAIPGGTPVDGQRLLIRFKDNGSAQTLTWNSVYRAIGVTLPTTTVAGKVLYVGCIYNSQDSYWDVIAVAEQ